MIGEVNGVHRHKSIRERDRWVFEKHENCLCDGMRRRQGSNHPTSSTKVFNVDLGHPWSLWGGVYLAKDPVHY